jgi:hypothetical protein
MKFIDIVEDITVFPGEYVYHEPTSAIVLCGAFVKEENLIKALGNGRYFTDSIDKFKKIEVNKNQLQARQYAGCKGCGG